MSCSLMLFILEVFPSSVFGYVYKYVSESCKLLKVGPALANFTYLFLTNRSESVTVKLFCYSVKTLVYLSVDPYYDDSYPRMAGNVGVLQCRKKVSPGCECIEMAMLICLWCCAKMHTMKNRFSCTTSALFLWFLLCFQDGVKLYEN
jgi:hypothetical protein